MSTTKTENKQYGLLINGALSPSSDKKMFDAVNPSNGESFARIADATSEDMQRAIAAARNAFDNGRWKGLSIEQRGEYLQKLARAIRDNAKELADLESMDTGKTSKQTTFIDVPTCADTFEYFGRITDAIKPRDNQVNAPVTSITDRDPVGVIGCIIPWNYPLIMAAWKMAPALIAGNTLVFKPSQLASVSILRLAELINDAGFPEGVINIVTSTQHDVASVLVDSPEVDKISFTGGTETGKEIMKRASSTLKKLTLELGGKSPNIVFGDCDFDAALGGTMSAIFMNQGQMCTAGSRLFVQDSIYDDFVKKLVKRAKGLKIGPALDYATEFGPVISAEQKENILQFIQKGVEQGATIACGGTAAEAEGLKNGFYVQPTILTDVQNDMYVAQEEAFGPVLCVMRFQNEEEVIRLANNSKYGLASCVWTKDEEKAKRAAKNLQCGIVWINTYGGFYNEASFGGYKQSGFGRELGLEGLLEFTQTKHVCFDKTPGGKSLATSWF